MWWRVLVVVGSVALVVGCGDEPAAETRTDRPESTPTSDAAAPLGGAVVPDRPAELQGEVTNREGDRFLVEEQPGRPDAGRKAWVAIEGPVFRGGDGAPVPATASDVAVGQLVSVWTGICAESYPEQCGAEALVIAAGAGEATAG
jgi:hypothetical protein